MKKNEEVEIWVHAKQSEDIQCTAKRRVRVWGRGTGKTSIIGLRNYDRVRLLPRARGFLGAPTYKSVLNNCLPAMEQMWNKLGFQEYDWKTKRGHYVIGRIPPSHFEKPYKPPREFQHIITFFNGLTIDMLSLERPISSRGPSYDFGDVDELALIKQEYVEQVLIPTIRGNVEYFGENHPLHRCFGGYTSMPWLSTGQWVLGYKEKIKKNPKLFHYSEANAILNLRMLGPDYVELMRESLTPEVFDVEIMNMQKVRGEILFYPKFEDSRHTYAPKISYVDDPTGRGIMFDRYEDWNKEQLIDLSFDFGGWFTGLLAFQQTHTRSGITITTEKMIDSMHVLKDGSVDELIDMFCEKYKPQKVRFVRVWGEPRGHDRSSHGDTLYEKVVKRFRWHGWTVELCAFVSPAHSHTARFTYMNEMLEDRPGYPRLRCNQETCKSPIMAIKFAERTDELKKDKKREKDRKEDQATTTHYTDALDYYFMQKHYARKRGTSMSADIA